MNLNAKRAQAEVTYSNPLALTQAQKGTVTIMTVTMITQADGTSTDVGKSESDSAREFNLTQNFRP